MFVFALQPDIHPHGAFVFDQRVGFLVADPAQHGFFQQFIEIPLGQAHQDAVGEHDDVRITFGLGQQRLFAEGVARAEGGQGQSRPGPGTAGNLAAALLDHVIVIALIAFFDDGVAGLDLYFLHPHEQGLYVGRRDLQEGPGL